MIIKYLHKVNTYRQHGYFTDLVFEYIVWSQTGLYMIYKTHIIIMHISFQNTKINKLIILMIFISVLKYAAL